MANRNVCFILSLVIFTSFIRSTESVSCCLRYTRRPLSHRRLLGYTIQTINNSCDINAIVFHIPGKFVCADPLMKWTQRGMKYVDERRKMAQIAEKRIRGSA
ncbi:putative C-C motif chemokine 20-like [Scophthalmus maximus]|nr:C-C motif chemokine 20b [Scophthalmus maximus]AWP21059.1 putative C-C motif chemokine 20-like [Scophthalmus maximus]